MDTSSLLILDINPYNLIYRYIPIYTHKKMNLFFSLFRREKNEPVLSDQSPA